MSGNRLINFAVYETIKVSASTTSASGVFTSLAAIVDMSDVSVYNETSATAYVGFYDSKSGTVNYSAVVPSTVPSLFSYPIGAGQTQVLSKNLAGYGGGADTCVVILASGSGNVYFSCGVGN